MKISSILFLISLLLITGCKPSEVNKKEQKPDNVIFLIGDGMGVAQVYAGWTANGGKLNLADADVCGFSITYSSSDFITDSGAGGTALSTGNKTYNGAIGVNNDTIPVKNLVEIAAELGKSTGVISTSSITHATPASFIAHVKSRKLEEDIAMQFLDSPVDVFIGGGQKFFERRSDSLNLISKLEEKGFSCFDSLGDFSTSGIAKLAVLTADNAESTMLNGRGDLLPRSLKTALEILSNNEKGFFVMAEGSQIDWGGHANDLPYIYTEMIDFDQTVGIARDFSKQHPNTLIIVTADHETGGLVITGGNPQNSEVQGDFLSKGHSAVMVPVFAFGPGAEDFGGIYQNTEIFNKIVALMRK